MNKNEWTKLGGIFYKIKSFQKVMLAFEGKIYSIENWVGACIGEATLHEAIKDSEIKVQRW